MRRWCWRESSWALKTNSGAFGVIAIGGIRSKLADALLVKGHQVIVWNRTVSKCEPMAEAGTAVVAKAPRAVAQAEIAVVCVLDHAAGTFPNVRNSAIENCFL